MKVVILAGGFGTRLSEETSLKPKPMVKIGDLPILLHIINLNHHKPMTASKPEELSAQVLHPEAGLPRRRAYQGCGRRRARGDREAGLPVGGAMGTKAFHDLKKLYS